MTSGHLTQPSKTSTLKRKEPLLGSVTRLYQNEYIVINPSTGERVEDTLRQTEILRRIKGEQAAKKIIFVLRDRCLRPHMHMPSTEELSTAFEALRALWLLLPPIERHKGESNKKYFLRTLDEVGRFRGVDMFTKD